MSFVLTGFALYFAFWQGLLEPRLPNHYIGAQDDRQLFIGLAFAAAAHLYHVFSVPVEQRHIRLAEANSVLAFLVSVLLPVVVVFGIGSDFATYEASMTNFNLRVGDVFSGGWREFGDEHPRLQAITIWISIALPLVIRAVMIAVFVQLLIFAIKKTVYASVPDTKESALAEEINHGGAIGGAMVLSVLAAAFAYV